MIDELSKPASPLIAIVDDDESVRESLPALLSAFKFDVCAFSSAEEFLGSDALDTADCLILDVAMPRMSGPELQSELVARQNQIPIVFISAHGDNNVRSRILATGAIAYLLKPFSTEALLAAVNKALAERS
jgi:FixJ family two-component response regulator